MVPKNIEEVNSEGVKYRMCQVSCIYFNEAQKTLAIVSLSASYTPLGEWTQQGNWYGELRMRVESCVPATCCVA